VLLCDPCSSLCDSGERRRPRTPVTFLAVLGDRDSLAYADGGAALIGRPGPLHDVLSRDDPAAAVELMVYPLARILDTGLGGRSHTIEGTLGRYRQGLRSAILEVHDRYLLRRIAPRLIRTWSAVHEDAVAAMGIDERHDPMVPLHASDRTAPNRALYRLAELGSW